ncbi:hypothetical protein NW752_003485 [Fusarium irregulare]|uniref:BTB domain-containing protein n=1 Tax=Fusarium irregulare TaxID=2494466 RepID=A0A9W8PSJ7_9HYPO|nr:hypothetical protein NW766_004557 [Fusarium irregulare]KAJ4023027.1 hypothetical protein NW752_003485 [Fusarium irregulare]
MASIMYEIDPGGDLNLVLKDPNTQRIVPTLCKEAEDDSDDPFNNPPLVGRYEIFNEADEDGYNPEEAGVSGPGSTEVTDITEVRMRVSSRHLILASRTFRKMLEGDWSDSSSKAIESGRRQIYTSGWDAAALAIVMDAIHGRHRDIPKSVNLGLMTRIATIVDYYELHESLQLIRDVWMTALRNACVVTTHYCKSTFLWLYLAWVFSEKDIIPPIIKMLLQQSNGFPEIDSFDLPVGGIMGPLNQQ